MATDPTLPTGEGAQLRELLRLLRDDQWLVFSEGPDHLGVQPGIPKLQDPVRRGLKKHRDLFIALTKDDCELTEADRKTILNNDVRLGFVPPNDWQGAARELRERGDLL